MESIQRKIYEALMEMVMKVRDGFYGSDSSFDVEAWDEDLNELLEEVWE